MKLTEKFVQFISSLFFMMFLGIGIIRTEKCWPNSPTYSTDVGVLRGWGRAQITVDILGREAKKVEKHWARVLSLVLKAVHASELPSAQILSVWSFGFVVCLFTVSVIVLWSVSFLPFSVSRPMSSIFSLRLILHCQLWISHSGCFC